MTRFVHGQPIAFLGLNGSGCPTVPIMTLSRASCRSSLVICLARRRAAPIAASLRRFLRSAPEKPGVPAAIRSRSRTSDQW